MTYAQLPDTELQRIFHTLRSERKQYDLTRGKPSQEQLDLAAGLLYDVNTSDDTGFDCRNYGYPEGLPPARQLAADYLQTPYKNTYVIGSSSLALMHDIIVQMLLRPLPGSTESWMDLISHYREKDIKVSMLCPSPGYDRHHEICELYGIHMLPVPLRDDGPDCTVIKNYLEDKRYHVVGMWCIPKYSNPTGTIYSEETCVQIAKLAARYNLALFWDLAYQEHHLTDELYAIPSAPTLSKKAWSEDSFWVFGSTSKITFASAGIAMLAASEKNLSWYLKSLTRQMIGSDKVNQLRHVNFLGNIEGIRTHLTKHREILAPKFAIVDNIMNREFQGHNTIRWNKPLGGYFVNVFTTPGTAKRAECLCAEMGLIITKAGAAFPYGKDPDDSHHRLAPSCVSLTDLPSAMERYTLALHIASREKDRSP